MNKKVIALFSSFQTNAQRLKMLFYNLENIFPECIAEKTEAGKLIDARALAEKIQYDKALLSELARNITKLEARTVFRQIYNWETTQVNVIKSMLLDPNQIVFITVDQEENLAGFLIGQVMNGKKATLKSLGSARFYEEYKYAGKPVGKNLLKLFFNYLLEKGYRQVIWGTDNVGAINFYNRVLTELGVRNLSSALYDLSAYKVDLSDMKSNYIN